MVIPFIFIIYILVLTLLIIGFAFKEYAIGSIASMAVIVLGIDLIVNGLLGTTNNVTSSMGIILLGLGFYILTKGQLDFVLENSGDE